MSGECARLLWSCELPLYEKKSQGDFLMWGNSQTFRSVNWMVQDRQFTKQQIKTSQLVTASVNAKNKFTTKEDNWFIYTIHICACVLACVDIEGLLETVMIKRLCTTVLRCLSVVLTPKIFWIWKRMCDAYWYSTTLPAEPEYNTVYCIYTCK